MIKGCAAPKIQALENTHRGVRCLSTGCLNMCFYLPSTEIVVSIKGRTVSV